MGEIRKRNFLLPGAMVKTIIDDVWIYATPFLTSTSQDDDLGSVDKTSLLFLVYYEERIGEYQDWAFVVSSTGPVGWIHANSLAPLRP